MKDYCKRGREWLWAWLAGAGILAGLYTVCRMTGTGGAYASLPVLLGTLTGGGTIMLTKFFVCRRMTPEQFAESQKKEKQNCDERGQAISGRACGLTLAVVGCALCVGLVLGDMLDNSVLLIYSGALLTLLAVVLFISRAVFRRKM